MEIIEREMELREDIEIGRRNKIALEVMKEFLDNHRETIIREFEGDSLDDLQVKEKLAELRVMRRFRDVCAKMISFGEIAESEIERYGK